MRSMVRRPQPTTHRRVLRSNMKNVRRAMPLVPNDFAAHPNPLPDVTNPARAVPSALPAIGRRLEESVAFGRSGQTSVSSVATFRDIRWTAPGTVKVANAQTQPCSRGWRRSSPCSPSPVAARRQRRDPVRRSAACAPATPRWPDAASWAKLNEAVGGNLIAVARPVRRLRDAIPAARLASDALANIRNPFYHRRPAGRHAGLRLARRLDAGAQRLRGEGAIERRCRRGGEFRARQRSAPGREGRRPQLSGHFQRAGLAADLDPGDEQGDAA